MIRTDRSGELIAECSECGTEEPGGTLDFPAFVASLKDMGWKIKKVESEWLHFCPECVEVE